ncbi:GPI2-domain-containing protein [Calocera cornea HHB12733]|uniref:GPI2-domain-containing protein n=1 Tax=Calocera cornea HHB12733 TaxID=1353952 RepID=A0A165F061_9BASI|nr:GPI2-domain-containing protein [Calocera cornea HHB12733]
MTELSVTITAASDGPAFRKILYGPQTRPTNYVPDNFLSSLQRNVNVRPHTYLNLLLNALPVTGFIAVLALFLALFGLLLEGTLPAAALVLLAGIVFVVGWIGYEAMGRTSQATKAVKSAILVTTFLLSLSPILRTLSQSTSSDTIYALATFLFLLSLLLFPSPYKTAGHIATTTSVSASLVLASRLPGSEDVFALLLLAVLAFSLFPILSERLRTTSTGPYILFTVLLSLSPLYAMSFLQLGGTSLIPAYAIIICAVTFGGPAALLYSQRFKNEIRGPWDPAVPLIRPMKGGL